MTQKLYWQTPYETKFTAKIKVIKKAGIVLDKTLFYPESGNQLSDKGYLEINDFKFEIEKVSKENKEVIHHISSDFQDKINIGDSVEGEIDWEYRYGLMKAHSSQHLFSAVLKNNYDIDTIRANINFEEIFLQISQKLDYEQLKEILHEVNTICTLKNLIIKQKIITHEQAEKRAKEIRSKIPDESKVRLIEIENLDLVCCGGTHVQTTTEIGSLFIFEFKKGNEIRFYVGNKALSIEASINVDIITLVNDLNTPVEKFRESVIKRLKTLGYTQNQQKELSIKLLELISKSPSKIVNNIPLFDIEFSVDIKIINKMLSNFPQNSLLIVEMGNRKIRLISKNGEIDANKLLQKLINKYKGKGGGNPKSAQALLEKMPENLLSEIEQFLLSKG